MKIVHYTGSLTRSAGGLFFSVSGLAKAQAAEGNSVLVVGPADDFFEADRQQWAGVELAAFTACNRYGMGLAPFAAIRRYRPDVVHVHGVWNASSVYGCFAQLLGAPVVVSPRGMLDPWILKRRPLAKAVHELVLERPLLRKAYVHALTHSEAAAVAEFEPAAKGRIFVVPNGILLPSRAPSPAERNGYLYLGRLHEKKQVRELVHFWKTIDPKRMPHLAIAGWGDDSYVEEIKALVAGHPKVSFLGSLYGDGKARAFERSRFFILPSLSEGLPMAALEAISYGCIPLLTRECNLDPLFAEGVAIEISTDLSALPSVVEGLSRETESNLGARSRAAQKAARNYAWPRVARATLEFYDDIARARRN